MKTIRCLDCGKVLEQPMKGIVAEAWIRYERDDKGGIYFFGYVCNQCHFDAIKREGWISG